MVREVSEVRAYLERKRPLFSEHARIRAMPELEVRANSAKPPHEATMCKMIKRDSLLNDEESST